MKRLTTSAPTRRERLAHQQQVPGENTRICDLSRPPANRLERRMIAHLSRVSKKLK